MFLDDRNSLIHPTVEVTSPELQDLIRSDSPSSEFYKNIEDLYTHVHSGKECFVNISQMQSLGIEFLCNDRGLYTIARSQEIARAANCQEFARVPVGHDRFDITAMLVADSVEENYNVRGINILSMR